VDVVIRRALPADARSAIRSPARFAARYHAEGRRHARPSDRVGPVLWGLLSANGRTASRSVAVHAEGTGAPAAGI